MFLNSANIFFGLPEGGCSSHGASPPPKPLTLGTPMTLAPDFFYILLKLNTAQKKTIGNRRWKTPLDKEVHKQIEFMKTQKWGEGATSPPPSNGVKMAPL